MGVNIRIGDRIKAAKGGGSLGVIREIWGDYASVEFDAGGTFHVPLKDLESLDALTREREGRDAREAADARYRERASDLSRLRAIVRSDFLNAESRLSLIHI